MLKLNSSLIFYFVFIFNVLANANELENVDSVLENFGISKHDLDISINNFIDSNLFSIQETLKPLDPLELRDVSAIKNRIRLTNGWLDNLSKINRSGSCSVAYDNKVASVDINMGWEYISYEYNYDIKLWFIKRKGEMVGKVSNLNINAVIDLDFHKYKIVLKNLAFTRVGKIDLKIYGNSGDKLRNFIIKLLINVTKDNIIKVMEKISYNLLKKAIDDVNTRIPHHSHQFTFVNLIDSNENTGIMQEYTSEINI